MQARWTVIGTATAVALLAATSPTPADAVATVLAPSSSADASAPVVAAASLVAWALTAWLVIVVGTTLLARAPGAAGAVGAALAGRLAPLAVRRAVEVALGLTVSAGVLAGPAAAATADTGGPAPAPASTSNATVSLDWPGAGTDPELDWPAPAAAAAPAAPSAPVRAAALPAAEEQQPVGPADPGTATVVVAPGDSLWVLAERHLASTTGAAPAAARTAAAWPSWWAANRDAVGDDPDVIHPGTVLRPPSES